MYFNTMAPINYKQIILHCLIADYNSVLVNKQSF